jgi:hypothetical protein
MIFSCKSILIGFFIFIQVVLAMNSLNGSGTSAATPLANSGLIGLNGPLDHFSTSLSFPEYFEKHASKSLLNTTRDFYRDIGIDDVLSSRWQNKLEEYILKYSRTSSFIENYEEIRLEFLSVIDGYLAEINHLKEISEYKKSNDTIHTVSTKLVKRDDLINTVYPHALQATRIFIKNLLQKMANIISTVKKTERISLIAEQIRSTLITIEEMENRYRMGVKEIVTFTREQPVQTFYAMDDLSQLFEEVTAVLKTPYFKYVENHDIVKGAVLHALTVHGAYVVNMTSVANVVRTDYKNPVRVDNSKNTHYYCFPTTVLFGEAMEMISFYYGQSFNTPEYVAKRSEAVFELELGDGSQAFKLLSYSYNFYLN